VVWDHRLNNSAISRIAVCKSHWQLGRMATENLAPAVISRFAVDRTSNIRLVSSNLGRLSLLKDNGGNTGSCEESI
jgi:hypothetical protein